MTFEKVLSLFMVTIILPWALAGVGLFFNKMQLFEVAFKLTAVLLVSWLVVGSLTFFIGVWFVQ
jgi:hypothetical protein